tara:strand:+ start:162 stop:1466 length:1305 start_codon:yes stop_codon:yes gene_type:complete
LIYLVIIINLLSFTLYRKAHIDFDSASHIYRAINNNQYKTGYRIGIKLPVILIYKQILNNITKSKYFFRFMNFLIINILSFIFLLKSERNIQNNLIILALMIILNSFWINPSTSSSEIYEILILILIIYTTGTLASLSHRILIVGFCSILLISFKFLNTLYLPSLYFLISEDLDSLMKNITFLFLFVASVLIVYNSKNSFTYVKNRTDVIHNKSKRFIMNNSYFSFNFLILIILSLKITEGFEVLIILTSLILLIVQKQYFSYFLLHISCLGLFFLLDKDFTELDKIISIFLISNFTILFIINLFKFYKIKNYYKLVRILQGESVSDYLSDQEKQVKELKTLVLNKSVYFIGVDIPLLINAEIYNVDNTFYNENHLTYWADEDNPQKFIIEEITSKRSDLILVSYPMAEYPESIFEKLNYKKIEKIGSLEIFSK